jgi:tRNA (guanine-N7-)-methyltransferase
MNLEFSRLLPDRPGYEMEIGPGKGMYILGRAAEDPRWGFVAVEVKARYARLIEEAARRRGLGNIAVIRADARLVVPAMGPDASLDRVCLHFPDPWWKRRHVRRAVLTPAILDHLVRLLRPGAELYVQTDVFARAERLLRMLTDHEALGNATSGGGLLDGRVTACTSNRERRCIEAGLPVFRMLFRKAGGD